MGRWFTPSKSDGSGMVAPQTPMPEAPTVGKAAEDAEKAAKKRKQAQASSKSVYTSPLGIGTEAEVAKKELLGQ